MNDVKINLSIVIPGATMMSEQECSKQLRKPVINKRGKYAGKQARDKNGNLLWYYESVPDLDKYDRHHFTIGLNHNEPNSKPEVITYFTRKSREARQSINMSNEAYVYFTSSEMPYNYKAPKNFKPYRPIRSHKDRKTKKWVEGMPIEQQAWKVLTPVQRLEWNLNNVAESLGGVMESYTVFND